LIEAFFWTFDKVPFTCSYLPGTSSLALLAGLYFFGFTNYAFRMATLESSLEKSVLYSALFFCFSTGVLIVRWNWRFADGAVRFDGK
jgi:hypothetical protein